MPFRSVPSNASVATSQDGRLFSPSAQRNQGAICDLLQEIAPDTGYALEIASGTGQHITRFAQAMGDLIWQPSEIDPSRRISIDAYAEEAGLTNLKPTLILDATHTEWSNSVPVQDLIVTINLLHLISYPEMKMLIGESAKALHETGTFFLYGPFKREGKLTSPGDEAFDQSLREHDGEIGYKDVSEVVETAHIAGLSLSAEFEMPANNLALVFRGS